MMFNQHIRRTSGRHLATIMFCFVLGAGSLYSQTPDKDAKFRLAQGFEQAGEYERAAELFRDLLHNEPGNFTYFDGLQRMLVQSKQYDEAIGLIQDRLKKTPNDQVLFGLLGTVQYRAGREAEAAGAWDRAIFVASSNPQSYRFVASLMIEVRLLDKAAEIYRKGRVACNDPTLYAIELAQLLVASMDYTSATEEFLLWLAQNPNQMGFVLNRFAAFTYKEDGRTAAIKVVQVHIDRTPTLPLYEILAWLFMEGKDFDNAYGVYRRIDDLSSANGVSILGFADKAFREQAYEIASRAYQEALKHPLTSQRIPQARYGRACALMELQLAHDSSGNLLRFSSSSLSPVRSHLGDAVTAFTKIAEDYPQSEYSAKSLYQLALIQFRYFQDLDAAALLFSRVLAEPAARPFVRFDVQLRMAELSVAKGDTVAATAALRSVGGAPGATPDQMDEAQLGLAEIAFFNGRIDDAVNLLATISKNVQNDFANDAIELQVVLQENAGAAPQALSEFGRAEFLARQHKYSEAVQRFLALAQQFSASPLVDDALLRAGGLLAQAGRYPEAMAVYDTLLTRFHDQSTMLDRALFRIAEIYQFGLGQPPKAIAAYERLIAEYGQSVLANDARKRIRALRGETM
jgi:tetratricopeptide (TPR) repeat protein